MDYTERMKKALNEQNAALDAALTRTYELEARNKELEEALEYVREENRELRNKNQELKSKSLEIVSLRDTIEHLKNALDFAEKEVNDLKKQPLWQDLFDLEQKVAALGAENQELKKVADSSLAYAKITELEKEIESLEASRDYDHTVISGLHKTTEHLRNENKDLKEKLEKATSNIHIPPLDLDVFWRDRDSSVERRLARIHPDGRCHKLLYNLATNKFVYVSKTQHMTKTGCHLTVEIELPGYGD